MKKFSCNGFTLIELVTALAVAGVLLSVGIPSFLSAIQNSKQSSDYQTLVTSLFLARSESVKQTSMVSVCARASDTTCATGVAADWSNGWLVFVDNPGVGKFVGQVDATDAIIQINPPTETTVTANALANGGGSLSPQSYIQYSPTGAANWQGGTLQLCDDRGATKALAMNIMLTGDIRKARGSGTPININQVAITCS